MANNRNLQEEEKFRGYVDAEDEISADLLGFNMNTLFEDKKVSVKKTKPKKDKPTKSTFFNSLSFPSNFILCLIL